MSPPLKIQSLGDDQGITGQLARVSLTYDTQEAGAPQSLIAKFAATEATTRNTFSGHYLREVRFYEELAPRTNLRTPHCYYSSLDVDTLEFVLLLEDLAPPAVVIGWQVVRWNRQKPPFARLPNSMPLGGTAQN